MNHRWKLDSAATASKFDWRCEACHAYVCDLSPVRDGCVGGPLLDPETPTAKFKIGEAWYSYDDGRSWTRAPYATKTSETVMVVTQIDRERGVIVLERPL